MTTIKAGYELDVINGNIPNPKNGVSSRPGDRMGLTAEQIKQYIKRQKKCRGFSQALSAGDNTPLSINLPGDARVMLGFALDFIDTNAPQTPLPTPTGKVTLIVNNEVMIENVRVRFFGDSYTDEEYYFLPRPLSGNDDIKMTIKGVAFVYTLELNFYYL